MENDIVKVRRKEEYWHKRCLDAEFELLQSNQKTGKKPRNNSNQSSGNNSSTGQPSGFLRIPWAQVIDMKSNEQDSDSLHDNNSDISKLDAN